MTSTPEMRRALTGRATRRNVVRGGAAAGAGLALAGSGRLGFQSVGAQGTPAASPVAFGRDASIVSWGFGLTNPLSTARAEAFMAANPSIAIEFVPELDDQKILTAAASETLPDLLWIDRGDMSSWAERGVVAPLTPFIESSGLNLADFYEAGVAEATYEGQVYGIPGGMDVRALYVNLDALAEIGVDGKTLDTSDWDMLADLGEQLVQRDGDRIVRWGFDTKLQAGYLWLWGLGNGGTFFNEDGTEATYDNEQVVDALKWGVDVYERQGGYQDYEAVASTWQGDEQFARGQVAMTMYESWMLGIVASVAPDLNFAVLPIRQRGSGPDGPEVSFAAGRAWSIPEGASDPEAAWHFISQMHTLDTWMIGAQARKEAAQSEGGNYIPALTGHIEADQRQIEELYDPISENVDAAVRLFPELLAASTNRPNSASPASAQLEDIMNEVAILPALRGETTPEDALSQANEDAQEAIEEFL